MGSFHNMRTFANLQLSVYQAMLYSVNPFDGVTLSTFPLLSDRELEERLQQAGLAASEWAHADFVSRRKVLSQAAQILRSQADYFAKLITLEMGKRLEESFSEVEKCAVAFEYYADEGEALLQTETVTSQHAGLDKEIQFQPLGVVLAIMPWNFPFWQVVRFLAPALIAGNGALLKHASNVPQAGFALEKLLLQAGLPKGVFQFLPISVMQVEAVIASPVVKAITLTGSEAAGKATGMLAGQYLKKSVLELGGSDPFVVLKDCDVQWAATKAVASRMINCGQSCIAAKRFIVHESLESDFIEACQQLLESLEYGNPLDSLTGFGPLAKPDLVSSLNFKITQSIQIGGNQLIMGGRVIGERGEAISPALIKLTNTQVPVWQEETFGPVMVIKSFNTIDQAVSLANDTPFGLGASVWGKDESLLFAVAGRIEAGSVFINEVMKSDVSLPFGGIKSSGYGRELSYYGMKEFVNVKTICKSR